MQDWLLFATDWNWRLMPAAGVALRATSDIGTHWMDLIAFMTGRRFPDTFKQLYRAIYGYLAAGNLSKPKPFLTFDHGHDEVVLCEAILRSHQARQWIMLEKQKKQTMDNG